jgi:hypothetical protein
VLLHRNNDRTRIRRPRSRNCLGQAVAALPFSGKCCFRDIYFVSNIFFLEPRRRPGAGFAETSWLTRADKNAWANRRQMLRFAGFASNFTPQGVTEAKRRD